MPGAGSSGLKFLLRRQTYRHSPIRTRYFIGFARKQNLQRTLMATTMNNKVMTLTDGRTDARPIPYPLTKAPSGMDLRQIKENADDFGLMAYDPAFMNTASCRSSITYIDGDRGILRYRGYPIEELAEKCTFLEVAYLLLNGELPNESELEEWVRPGEAPHDAA